MTARDPRLDPRVGDLLRPRDHVNTRDDRLVRAVDGGDGAMISVVLILLHALTIPAANYLIGHVGTVCVPNGPCLIPVFPGIDAPSGVMMIGAALVLRDLVQRRCGILISLGCIVGGALLSVVIAPPALVVASASAFLLSELADFAVYTPLAKRRFLLAVLLSCAAGAVVDSAAFLWLAFGSLAFIWGQVIGKLYAAFVYLVFQRGRCGLGIHSWTSNKTYMGEWSETCSRCGKSDGGSNRN